MYPFTILTGRPGVGKSSILKLMHMATHIARSSSLGHFYRLMLPNHRGKCVELNIDDYSLRHCDGKVKVEGQLPWEYSMYMFRGYPLYIKTLVEAARLRGQLYNDVSMPTLAGVIGVFSQVLQRYYDVQTFYGRLALFACDLFSQVGMKEHCADFRRALYGVFAGLGEKALRKLLGDFIDQVEKIPEHELYTILLEKMVEKVRSNSVVFIECMCQLIDISRIQEAVARRIDKGDKIYVVAALNAPKYKAEVFKDKLLEVAIKILGWQPVEGLSAAYLVERKDNQTILKQLFPQQ